MENHNKDNMRFKKIDLSREQISEMARVREDQLMGIGANKVADLALLCYLAEKFDNMTLNLYPIDSIENPKETNEFQYFYSVRSPKFELVNTNERLYLIYSRLCEKYKDCYSTVEKKYR